MKLGARGSVGAERSKLNMRMHQRRMTRLINAFSKREASRTTNV
jgi:hypothetical protein